MRRICLFSSFLSLLLNLNLTQCLAFYSERVAEWLNHCGARDPAGSNPGAAESVGQ